MLTDGIYPIINLLATIALFYAARRSSDQSKRLGLAWGVIDLAQFIYMLADLAWWILEAVLNRQPFPSVADGFYLAYYPLFLVGIFLLPKMHFSRKEWLETALDLTIVMLAAILGF